MKVLVRKVESRKYLSTGTRQALLKTEESEANCMGSNNCLLKIYQGIIDVHVNMKLRWFYDKKWATMCLGRAGWMDRS